MTTKNNSLAADLLVGNFERQGPDAKKLSDPLVDTPMVLTLDQLKPYEHNPRLTRNPLYSEIRTSIQQRGLDSTPVVTRRPGEEHYIIHNGGNTRLSILRELWSKTKEERFFRILCIFRPWHGELVALTGHLAENELHGNLTFIEQALGVQKAQEIHEQECGSITQVELAQLLTKNGFPCDRTKVSRMFDAINLLLPAIPEALYGGLNNHFARRLLALRQSSKRYWIEHGNAENIEEDFHELFQDTLMSFDNPDPSELDFNRIQDELVGLLAKLTDQSYDLVAFELRYGGKASKNKESASPDSAHLSEITEPPIPQAFVKPDLSEVMAQAKEHASRFVLRPPPAAAQPRKPSQSPSGLMSADSQDLLQGHIVSGAETSERVQAIQQLVADHTGESLPNFSDNVLKAIPVQAGGLFPISDVWFIEPAIDTPECLRTRIEQLAVEIAAEEECEDLIEHTEEGIGFRCRFEETTPALVLLGALSATPKGKEARLYERIAQLLLDGEDRLSDTAVVKLFRLIRLSRRLTELIAAQA